MKKDHLLAIGIMTGNSLDAADVVLTAFHESGKIRDLAFYSLASPEWLFHALKDLRAAINRADGDMDQIAKEYRYNVAGKYSSFDEVLQAYMEFILQAVEGLRQKLKNDKTIPAEYDTSSIDLIGFHGQTCAHAPPSARGKDAAFTVQIGDGQWLADATGITTVNDFRSDDIMHGGEGAPFAPMHNRHIAKDLENTGQFPICFINGGNTSNIANVTYDKSGHITVVGWDAGPFNHFPDMLMRQEKNMPCDKDGKIGGTGKINMALLEKLFHGSAKTQNGDNFYLLPPPKSSDPQWYKLIPELTDASSPLEDRLRTAEYLSAYALYHSLGHTDASLEMPIHFAVFGGGWKNPVTFRHFQDLLQGDFESAPVLEGHKKWFAAIHARIHKKSKPVLKWSNQYGFDGAAMEARIFADMARCKAMGIPFTNKDITGAARPVICGVVHYPKKSKLNATANLREWMIEDQKTDQGLSDPRWSRAAKGWNN